MAIPFDYTSEYKRKLRTPEEAARVVKSGDWLDISMGGAFPSLMDEAIAKRKDELRGVKIRGYLIQQPIQMVECDPSREHFIYNSWHMSGYERKLCDRGLCNFNPMVFRNLGAYYDHFLTVNVAITCVTPMNEHGYFNFSVSNASARAVLDKADVVILEVNENLPWVYGGLDECIHIDDVDMIVEGPHGPLPGIKTPAVRRIRYLRLTGRQRRWVWLWLTVLLVTGLCCAAVLHMRPIIVSLATARVSNAVNRIVVDAVRDAIDSGQVNYDVLIHLEKDETGRVAALESNMAAFNRLRSQIADEILRRLSEVSTSELSIPVGTLTGSTLLAGRGPCVRVRMQAVGSADASLRNAFSAAGINQTRHQILLSVDVYTSILLPGFTASTKVSNEIAVAETVIVGSVPETYTYFSTTPDELEDTARDNIMNKG